MDNIKAAFQAAAEQENLTLAELVRLRAFNQRLVALVVDMRDTLNTVRGDARATGVEHALGAANKLIMADVLTPRHDAYIARIKERGGVTVTYTMPCCGGQGETQAAPEGETWTTSATCHHCGELYIKITSGSTVGVSK